MTTASNDDFINVEDWAWYQKAQEEMTFASMLTAARAANNWTLKDAAEKLGVTQQAINGYERGARKPSLKQAKRFGEIFGLGNAFAIQWMKDQAREVGLNLDIRLAS